MQSTQENKNGTNGNGKKKLGKKILIVEDEAAMVKVLTLKLEKAGFSVESAGDGAQALGILGKASFDLILLD